MPLGLAFYHWDVVVAERGWPLFECLDHLHKETSITFTDEQLPRELNMKLLIPFNGKLGDLSLCYTYSRQR